MKLAQSKAGVLFISIVRAGNELWACGSRIIGRKRNEASANTEVKEKSEATERLETAKTAEEAEAGAIVRDASSRFSL